MPKDKEKKKKKVTNDKLPEAMQTKKFEMPEEFSKDRARSTMDKPTESAKIPESKKDEPKKPSGKLREETDQPVIHRDRESGDIAAVSLPDGRVFAGMDEDRLAALAESQAPKTTPKGAIERKELKAQRQEEMEQYQQERFNPEDVQRFLESVQRKEGELSPTAIQQEQATREQRLQNIQDRSLMGILGMSPERQKSTIQSNTLNRWTELAARGERSLGGLGGDIIGVNINDVVDIFSSREEASNLEAAMGKLGETASAVRGLADSGGIPADEAIARLNQQSENVGILEDRIHKAAAQTPSIKTTGEYVDALTEIQKTKIELEEARADVLDKKRSGDDTLNLAETQRILEQLETNINKG